MQISKPARSLMIQTLSLAAAQARSNANMFSEFEASQSEEIQQLILNFKYEAQLFDEAISALFADY